MKKLGQFIRKHRKKIYGIAIIIVPVLLSTLDNPIVQTVLNLLLEHLNSIQTFIFN